MEGLKPRQFFLGTFLWRIILLFYGKMYDVIPNSDEFGAVKQVNYSKDFDISNETDSVTKHLLMMDLYPSNVGFKTSAGI